MQTPEQLKATLADWDDDTIEGYWELVDAAASVQANQGNPEKAEQYRVLAETCEDVLQERWAHK